MGRKVEIGKLRVRKDLLIRSDLNEDAVQRYMDLYRSGKQKAIKVQSKTYTVIEGIHRLEACRRLGLKDILVDFIDAEDSELRSLAYKYNKAHGVPISREERNSLILVLYLQDGKTQQQIADLMGLDRSLISKIISNVKIHNPNNDADKRRELTREHYPAIARLILGKEKQREIAEKFGVSQGRISQVWAEIRDEIHKFYTEKKLLKREVAEKVELRTDEVDLILQQYGDPLNFEPLTTTWWPTFGLDNRFGKENPSNLPAGLVRNVLALYTRPRDIILDPAAGGGVVLDVTDDMVNRKCLAYDLMPKRPDIKPFNILNGPPPQPETPHLIFIDLPYGPQKTQQYSVDPDDLANMPIPQFLDSLSKVFNYWNSGTLVVLMSSYKGPSGFVDLPYEAEKRMVDAGWRIVEHIVNEHGRIPSETGFWIEKARKERWLLRRHVHILVGVKP